MLTYRVLAALLAYPESETIAALDEAGEIIAGEGLVPPPARAALAELFESMRAGDLLDLQERYVALFDRRGSVSLHLYEHVHGESRDRGQAMVRLAQLYRLHGLEIAARELPDHLPLYLEFLSVLPPAAARRFLTEALPIVTPIGERLREWRNPYAAIFEALVAIGSPEAAFPARAGVHHSTAVSSKARVPASAGTATGVADEDDPEALDREWEEQEVSFMGAAPAGGEACSPFRAATSRGVG